MSDEGEMSVQMNIIKMHYNACKYCINGSTMNGINALVRTAGVIWSNLRVVLGAQPSHHNYAACTAHPHQARTIRHPAHTARCLRVTSLETHHAPTQHCIAMVAAASNQCCASQAGQSCLDTAGGCGVVLELQTIYRRCFHNHREGLF